MRLCTMHGGHVFLRVFAGIVVLITAAWAVPSGAATPDDTLVIAYNRATNQLHPGANSSLPNIMANMLLYDSLVIHDNEGKLYPGLAKTWDVSSDGKTWTFHLRTDVTFHSGRKFTAKDVKAHFDAWKSMPTAVKILSLEETVVVDDYTVQCKLQSANLVFLNMISQTEFGYSGIPDSAAVEKFGVDYGVIPESVSGTGPFILKKWIRNDRMEFERNPSYKWGPSFYKNQGPAKIQKVVIRTIPEEAASSAALETGEIDVDLTLSPKDAPRFKNTKGIQVVSRPKITAHTLGFNHELPMWKDVRVRRAMMYAIDQKAIVDFVYNGFAKPSIGLWSDSVEGHTPKDQMAKLMPKYDPEQAKKLLDEAGWKPGPDAIRVKDGNRLEFLVRIYSEEQANIMTVVQENFRQIGAKANLNMTEYAAWQKDMRAKNHGMRYVDGTHSTADFAYWFVCKSIPYPNHVYWCDPKTDKFFEISQTTTNAAERVKAFQDFEQDFVERAIAIPMPHTMWIVGQSDRVKDLSLHPIHSIYKLLDAHK
jgi:ABC-type transport system substrate-binding protein